MQKRHNINFLIVFLFLFFFFIFKFIYLYFLNLPLSYDEAYYWDWSRALDWGYYNKPPMIAWIIRISTEILGNSELAVRLPALICHILTLLFSYFLIAKYFDKTKAFFLLITISFIPIMTVYSFIMTVDPPLILFWILSLYFFCEYLKSPNYRNAFFTGLFIGLGLLTKQTMFGFLILGLVYLIIFNKTFLFKKETFLLFLVALLIYFPNIYWNYTHQFILFKHTEEHFTRKTLSLYSFLKFLVGCTLVYTPLFLVFFYLGTAYTKNLFKKQFSEILDFLYFLSFPPILVLIFLSFFIRLNVNWILPFVLIGFIFSFAYISFSQKWKVLIFSNLVIGIILSSLVYLLGYFPQKFPGSLQILLKKFIGWKVLAEKVEKYYKPGIPIVTKNRSVASSLAFYMKSHPKVYVIQLEKFPENQYHLWRKTDNLVKKRVIVVKKWLDSPYYLENAKKLDEVIIKITEKRYKYFSIWEGIFKKLR